MFDKLPDLPESKNQSLKTTQECLKVESMMANKPTAYPSCQDCGNPYEYFQKEMVEDEATHILITSWPACGWIQGLEVLSKQ